jgi:hypothetical protein
MSSVFIHWNSMSTKRQAQQAQQAQGKAPEGLAGLFKLEAVQNAKATASDCLSVAKGWEPGM